MICSQRVYDSHIQERFKIPESSVLAGPVLVFLFGAPDLRDRLFCCPDGGL